MPLRGIGQEDPGAHNPGLFQSVRTFWRVLIAILYTRLDLLTTELGEEAYRILYLAIAVVVGLICLHLALFFFTLWLVLILWETPYLFWGVGGIAFFYFLITAGCAFYASRVLHNRPRFLGQTLDELRRDAEGLQTVMKTPEPKP